MKKEKLRSSAIEKLTIGGPSFIRVTYRVDLLRLQQSFKNNKTSWAEALDLPNFRSSNVIGHSFIFASLLLASISKSNLNPFGLNEGSKSIK